MIPEAKEWIFDKITSDRRKYLEQDIPFEETTKCILSSCQIFCCDYEKYHTPPDGTPDNTKQVLFKINTKKEFFDLFYSSRDGLRGRYWQSPDIGNVATKYFISQMEERLIDYWKVKRGTDDLDFVRASLNEASAKVWIAEKDDGGSYLVKNGCETTICVERWKRNQIEAKKEDERWKCAPVGNCIEIKGALLDPDLGEHIPVSKRDRSCQIHRFGYT
ncbi:hypothetical protein [Nisaea nitritireducens]|uniref:hypothetical protein n=1 Tax=Nisaea nitritireducens TaxID=568392 RepID=UPI001866FF86|nr:hypothetical protein [Nisaea nitritireducens]